MKLNTEMNLYFSEWQTACDFIINLQCDERVLPAFDAYSFFAILSDSASYWHNYYYANSAQFMCTLLLINNCEHMLYEIKQFS